MPSLTRGAFLKTAAASAAALALAACSTGSKDDAGSGSSAAASSSAEESAFPVTIEHAYGKTTIDAEPKRVVGIGWINAEVALSLGVVPVGSGQVGWGENSNHSTDWFDDRIKELAAEQPTRFTETDGINYEEIAKLEPDLILAVVGTVDQEAYDKLTKIAPTVTHAKDSDGWTTAWQDYTKTIGTALGRPEHAGTVISETEEKIQDKAAQHEELKGATFISSALSVTDGQPSISVYTKGDGRVTFMKSLGMEEADAVKDAKADTFYIQWSNEKAADLKSDMIYSWIEKDSDVQTIEDNATLKQIPAIAKGASVLDSDKQETLALGISPLGMDWLVEHTDFIDKVAEAAKTGRE